MIDEIKQRPFRTFIASAFGTLAGALISALLDNPFLAIAIGAVVVALALKASDEM